MRGDRSFKLSPLRVLGIDAMSLFFASSSSTAMSELEQIKEEIKETKAKLRRAEDEGREALILMYGNNLTELRKKENYLLGQLVPAVPGKSASTKL